MSPMKRGSRAALPTTSAHWFHGGGRRSPMYCASASQARSRQPRRTKLPTRRSSYGVYAVHGLPPGRRARISRHARSKVPRRRSGGRRCCAPPGDSAIVVEVASKSPRSAAPGMYAVRCQAALAAIEASRSRWNSSRAAARRARGRSVAELAGDPRSVAVAGEGPEVVPVRVRGLGGVALVADRGRQEAVQRAALGRLVRGDARGEADLVHAAGRGLHVRPERGEPRAIGRVAVQRRGEDDQLAVAVVLGHGDGAGGLDAAGHLARGKLIRRVPAQEALGDLRVAEAEQRLADHGAVTDPGARVRPRAGAEESARRARAACTRARSAAWR